MTKRLLPLLEAGDTRRIIIVSSKAALFGRIRRKNFFSTKHPHGFKAYSASKLAVILWSRHLSGTADGMDVIAVHPGEVASNIWTGDSFFMRMMAPIVRKRYQTIEEGAETGIYLASADDVSAFNGCFVEKRSRVIPYNKRCSDTGLGAWLSAETKSFFSKSGFLTD